MTTRPTRKVTTVMLLAAVVSVAVLSPIAAARAAIDPASGAVEQAKTLTAQTAATTVISGVSTAFWIKAAAVMTACAAGEVPKPLIEIVGLGKGALPVTDLAVGIETGLTCIETAQQTANSYTSAVANTIGAVANVGTEGYTGASARKQVIYDPLATALLKIAIALTRDMVIRWIATGRFEAPVFVTSFSADLAKVAENASRIFLSELTDINFCTSIRAPDRQTFKVSADFGLDCTLPSQYDREYTDTIITLATNPRALKHEVRGALADPNNISTDVTIIAIDEQQKAIARALIARGAEYVTGDGFLGIRDAQGRIKTPGNLVAGLVMQSQIVSPIRQSDVADDVQTAIASIVDTAVRVVIEKGLSAAFSPSRR